MEDKNKLIHWVKKNRKALIATGISLGLIVAIVYGIKNAGKIKALWASLHNAIEKPAMSAAHTSAPVITEQTAANVTRNSCTVPFDVSAHLRILPEGWHASAGKVATAFENGFVLKDGQTWVDAFTKGKAA